MLSRYEFAGVFLPSGELAPEHSILECGGIIKGVMPTARARAESPVGTAVQDRRGQIALPGFVDGHSHFPDIGLWTRCWTTVSSDLNPANSVREVLARVAKWAVVNSYKGWIVGYGMLREEIQEGRFPTRQELDAICANRPLVLFDRTFHQAVANSAFIRMHYSGAPGADVDLERGFFNEDGMKPIFAALPPFEYADYLSGIEHAQDIYLASGFTTVQVGALQKIAYLDFLLRAFDEKRLLPKVVVWPMLKTLKDLHARDPATLHRRNVRVGHIKLFADGEFNLGTASGRHMRLRCPGCTIVAYDRERIEESIRRLAPEYDLAVHANGDDATAHVIRLLRACSRGDRRHILVHATLLDPNMLEPEASPEITPTFLTSRIKYADLQSLERTFGAATGDIFPVGGTHRAGVPYSVHTDAPVSPVSSIDLLESATLRRDRSGAIVGEHQRISLRDAILACTAYPAWQNRLDSIGVLAAGKSFDVCVYDGDELSLQVLQRPTEVYIDGRLVRRNA